LWIVPLSGRASRTPVAERRGYVIFLLVLIVTMGGVLPSVLPDRPKCACALAERKRVCKSFGTGFVLGSRANEALRLSGAQTPEDATRMSRQRFEQRKIIVSKILSAARKVLAFVGCVLCWPLPPLRTCVSAVKRLGRWIIWLVVFGVSVAAVVKMVIAGVDPAAAVAAVAGCAALAAVVVDKLGDPGAENA
jgi:hypothetical protein